MSLDQLMHAGVTDTKDDKARRAVKAFQALQPTLTAYARLLTKRKDVRVVMAADDNGSTDGKRIFFRPPIELGENRAHERRLCDKRDENLQLLCAACGARERVLVTIYHEIEHICCETMTPPDESDILRMIEGAVENHGTKYGDAIMERIQRLPKLHRSSFLGVAAVISPFLPLLVNALEDARVNGEGFKARPGTKLMFEADAWDTFTKGVEQRDPETGEFMRKEWRDYPLNMQVIIGVFCKASGYKYESFFQPNVIEALSDPELTRLVGGLKTARSVSAVYFLSFPILARLRELGYCKSDMDPQTEPEPEPEPEPEEDEDEGDESDDTGEQDETPEAGASEDDEQQDADSSEDASDEASAGSEEAEREVDQSGSDDGAEQDQPSDPTGDEDEEDAGAGEAGTGEPGEESAGDGTPDGDAEGSGESGSDGGLDDDDVSPEGEGGHRDQEVGQAQPESTDDRSDDGDGRDSGGTGAPESSSEPQEGAVDDADSEADQGGTGELDDEAREEDGERGGGGNRAGALPAHLDDPASDAEPPEDNGEAGEEVSDGPADADLPGESTDDDDADGELDVQPDSGGTGVPEDGDSDESDDRRGDDEAPLEGVAGHGEPEEGPEADVEVEPSDEGVGDSLRSDGEPIDSGADRGLGGIEVIEDEANDELPLGDAEDIQVHLDEWMGHVDPPKSIQEQQDDREIIDRAIVQGIYFETPSQTIFGVREHKWGDPILVDDYNVSGAWDVNRYSRSGREIGREGEFHPSETIIGPALLPMRVTFSNNKRGSERYHLKGGKVNNKVLGKRAHLGDERLFKKRTLPGKRDYFVLIGMDVSGSTVGKNIVLEKKAVMAQAELLHRMGIPFAIYAHSGTFHKPKGGRTYGHDLDIYLVKEPNEHWSKDVQERVTSLGPDSSNLDGHSMEYYRKVLDRVSATDKILLYYTDGKMPAENYQEELEILQREIKTCRRKNYTLLAVGIRTDSPIEHGLDTVQVDSDADIVKVIKHLEKRLLA